MSGSVTKTAKTRRIPMPGIEELAKSMSTAELAKHYGCTPAAMYDRLVRRGLMKRHRCAMDDIATLCQTMTQAQLCAHYKCSRTAIYERLRALGLSAAPAERTYAHLRGRSVRQQWTRHAIVNDQPRGVPDMAANFLRRECPVYRVGHDGKPWPRGPFFCRGKMMMTEAELVAFAERKGWVNNAR